MNESEAYEYLGRLVETMPALTPKEITPQTLHWLARVQSHVKKFKTDMDLRRFEVMANYIVQGNSSEANRNEFLFLLYTALAQYEVNAPVASRGAFIAVGNSFDAHVAVGNLLKTATHSVRIIDPYMDETMLTDFAVLAPEKITVELLTDKAYVRPGFSPAAKAFSLQFGSQRPLEARLTSPKALHDRLIIVDQSAVWTLTQSLKDFARRSPASIIKADADIAPLKVHAYETYWKAATLA
ncbi:phosphatidylserine/phosphatidylglycerophosphate/cardiolipin synthase family protein [Neorhizobium alkalisoli]|uniref:Uncharacterized protein n=1 Tax=Neorhizobium alkalisoli TaxID=528178 RepID=A0A561QSE3_9HYPH|nr:phosphatidylserine/phosphatidylglycerophosphate/cardiolipin synthase family protein [Neorhizobium alkalisoli]TWF53305.1 hypothetical protein FHW37_104584 [Neorhizobium alkalisoli]